jgi:hypothetical protein
MIIRKASFVCFPRGRSGLPVRLQHNLFLELTKSELLEKEVHVPGYDKPHGTRATS